MKTFTQASHPLKMLVTVSGCLLISLSVLAQMTQVDVVITGGLEDSSLQKKIELNLEKLLNELNSAYRSKAPKLSLSGSWFSGNFKQELDELWDHSHFFCYQKQVKENIIHKMNTGDLSIRNIPIILQSGDTTEVKVSILNDGVFDGFSPAIPEQQYKAAMTYTSTIDLTRKEIILDFMENMKTAYIKKDIDFIERIFSDKALIIIGKKSQIKEVENTDGMKMNLPKEKVEYIQITKSQYIERLKKVFQKNSYVNVAFDRFELSKHRKLDDFYGVTLRQRWNTPTYTDVGIMFFLIQFEKDSLPKIWVRTWQDEKAVRLGESVYGFGDFVIR